MRILLFLILILFTLYPASAGFIKSDEDNLKNIFLAQGTSSNNISVMSFQGGYRFYSTGDHQENITISVPPGKLPKIQSIYPVIHTDDKGNSKIVFIIPSNNNGMLDFTLNFSSNCIGCYTGYTNQTYQNVTNTSILNLSAGPFNSNNITALTSDLTSPTLTKNLTSSCHGEMNTSGLVLCMNLENTSGTKAIDESGYGNNGTLTNMNTTGDNLTSGWNIGKIGNGLRFDGVDDSVSIPDSNSLHGMNNLTIEAWVTIKSYTPNYQGIVGKWGLVDGRNHYILGYIYSGKLYFFIQNNTTSFDSINVTQPALNTLTHIVAVFTGNESLKIYYNGQLQGSKSTTISVIGSVDETLLIGRYSTYYFNGSIDEVRIYNRSLNATEISYNYRNSPKAVQIHTNANLTESANYSQTDMPATVSIPFHANDASIDNPGSVVSTVGEVLHYSFNESSGASAFDRSGNGNNGTLTNMNTTGNATSGWNSSNCKYRGCLQFDGVDDYVNAGNGTSLNITGNFTVSFWFKTNSTSQSNKYILNKNNKYALLYEYTNDKIEMYGSFSGDDLRTGSGITVSDTNWHHITYSYAPKQWMGFLDGNQVFNLNKTAIVASNLVDILYFGASDAGVNNQFNGSIDEVRIWNRSLSEEEVYALYSNGAIDHLHFVYPNNASVDGLTIYDYADNTNLTSAKISIGYTENSTTVTENTTSFIYNFNSSILHANAGIGNITLSYGDATFLADPIKGTPTLTSNNTNATLSYNSTHYIIHEGLVDNTTLYWYNISRPIGGNLTGFTSYPIIKYGVSAVVVIAGIAYFFRRLTRRT